MCRERLWSYSPFPLFPPVQILSLPFVHNEQGRSSQVSDVHCRVKNANSSEVLQKSQNWRGHDFSKHYVDLPAILNLGYATGTARIVFKLDSYRTCHNVPCKILQRASSSVPRIIYRIAVCVPYAYFSSCPRLNTIYLTIPSVIVKWRPRDSYHRP